MHRKINQARARRLLLAAVVGATVMLSAAPTQAQELPTGAARVVKKVQIMALTGKNEMEYKVGLIVANNAERLPRP